MADISAILQDESVQARFWSKVHRREAGECWVWATPRSNGYGDFTLPGGKRIGAHRASFILHGGTYGFEEVTDHLCRNRACVNPAHLEAVTNQENTRRGLAGDHRRRERLAATHCRRGHALVVGNLKQRKDGARDCLTCWREVYGPRNNAQRRAKRAAIREQAK